MTAATNKRERLIQAARELIHRQGYNKTTLSDIADSSGVPLGNVYYYFKTKDEIGSAVIHERGEELDQMYNQWNELPNALDRLNALLDLPLQMRAIITSSGCPIGSLAQELNKENNDLTHEAARLLNNQVHWAAEQFNQLGSAKPEDDAVFLLSTIQGSLLFANSLRQPDTVNRQISRLREWLENFTPPCAKAHAGNRQGLT